MLSEVQVFVVLYGVSTVSCLAHGTETRKQENPRKGRADRGGDAQARRRHKLSKGARSQAASTSWPTSDRRHRCLQGHK